MVSKQVAWITQGPGAGKVMQLPTADFAKAVKDGWAVPLKNGGKAATDPTATNPAAEAYFSKLPGYSTRELRAGDSAAKPAAGSVAVPAAGEAPTADEAPAPAKGKPGRKPKAKADEPKAETIPNSSGKSE